jgi:hypothetical protein
MRLLLTFTTAFLFAALFSILPRNIIIKESKELNYTFVKVVPCVGKIKCVCFGSRHGTIGRKSHI